MCFDVDTGLLVRFDTDAGEKDANSRVVIGDYRPVDKIRFSFAAAMSTLKPVWIRQLSEVRINIPVEDGLFLKASVANDADQR